MGSRRPLPYRPRRRPFPGDAERGEDEGDTPRNFLLNAANDAATKLAEQLASPDVVLPTLLSSLGAPIALVGFSSRCGAAARWRRSW